MSAEPFKIFLQLLHRKQTQPSPPPELGNFTKVTRQPEFLSDSEDAILCFSHSTGILPIPLESYFMVYILFKKLIKINFAS